MLYTQCVYIAYAVHIVKIKLIYVSIDSLPGYGKAIKIMKRQVLEMKVLNVGSAYNIYANKPAVSRMKAKTGEKKDDFNVSAQARDFQTAYKAAMNAPDVREDRISAIKEQMDKGTYNVSADDVAEKILSQLA